MLCKTNKSRQPERFYFIVAEGNLFYFKSNKEKLPLGIVPLENVRITTENTKKLKIKLLPPEGEKIKTIKSSKPLLFTKFNCYQDSMKEHKQWLSFIQQNAFSAPLYNKRK